MSRGRPCQAMANALFLSLLTSHYVCQGCMGPDSGSSIWYAPGCIQFVALAAKHQYKHTHMNILGNYSNTPMYCTDQSQKTVGSATTSHEPGQNKQISDSILFFHVDLWKGKYSGTPAPLANKINNPQRNKDICAWSSTHKCWSGHTAFAL